MGEGVIAFIIWAIVGIIFIGMGIYEIVSKKGKTFAFGFWANAKTAPIENVKAYNRALGKLWCAYGIAFILMGIPLLSSGEQNSGLIIIPILGTMVISILAMGIYMVGIEGKYRKK